MTPAPAEVAAALHAHLPPVFRWAGRVASRMRSFDIAVAGKVSGSSNTDALTLADLSVQELVVTALRDLDPRFRACRIEAEEETGPLEAFAEDSPLTLCLDPIDGTKQYRDHAGDGWAVMLNLRTDDAVHYSLTYVPDAGPTGRWVECVGAGAGAKVRCGEDNPEVPAGQALGSLEPRPVPEPGAAKKIYVIGFQHRDPAAAAAITAAGLEGVVADETPGSIYDLMADGVFAGSLIHSPNVYDYPAAAQIATAFGGGSVWCDTGEPVHYRELWMDEKADMLRLPRVVATASDPQTLATLREVGRGWHPERYRDGDAL
ncbi:inositol monophosphatase family protein [Alienimonas sp. DA493]|uniref:inositol monophosphatase family protein n=1 Tax=Alienimonas sp. DA493 TaxID=3373605 RepID=UPI003754A172